MEYNRKEFLKKALAVAAGGAIAEVLCGEELIAGIGPDAAARFAMVVDIMKCSRKKGCTDCVAACHRAHNVPSFADPRREIKWIWKEEFVRAFPGERSPFLREDLKAIKPVVLCNHCDNPPCVRVCPTKATWKRPDGIVMMDMHRCIGCRYCMAACPYGSRSFNWSDPRKALPEKDIDPSYPTRAKGVVEKCDFCAERVDRGLAPVCVGACKEKALAFGNLSDPASPLRAMLAGRYAIRRKTELGTDPQIYYLV